MSCSRRFDRNSCRLHNCCRNREYRPYPPDPIPPRPRNLVTIPIVPMDVLPDADQVKNGSIVLVGKQLPDKMDPNNMPNPLDYYFAVANGCYYLGFSPSMLGCQTGTPMPPGGMI